MVKSMAENPFKNRRPELEAILRKYNACENSLLTDALLVLIRDCRIESLNVLQKNILDRLREKF